MHNILPEYEFRPDQTTEELAAVEHLKISSETYKGENGVSTFSVVLVRSFH